MIHPVAGIASVAGGLAALIVAVQMAQKRWNLEPELTRKLVHVVMGLVCLSFPWVFQNQWPVWVLALCAVTTLASLRSVPFLRARFGRVLNGIDRQSWGELLFPLSVAFVFSLAHANILLYCVPVLIMTLADATAAMVGQRYGRAQYETDDGQKSIEGSVAFFLVTFFSAHVPLLLGSETGRLESLLIAAVLALIVMLMEAISWRGLDNLFVPVLSYVCLTRMVDLNARDLVWRFIVLVLFVLGWALWRRRTRLTRSAAVAAGLVLYVAWALGDAHWLIAPLATTIGYTVLCRLPVAQPRPHSVHAIFAVASLGLCWLALARMLGTVNTIYAYGVAFAANLGMIALARFADRRVGNSLPVATVKSALIGFSIVAIPYYVVWHRNDHAAILVGAAAMLVFLAVSLFALSQPRLRDCPVDAERLTRQSAIAAAVSTGAFAIISKLEPWSHSFQ